MALDGDQSSNAKHAWRAVIRLRRSAGANPVVDDLKAGLGEAFRLREVLRQTARDRDVHVREPRNEAVGEREPAVLAELVEAVLRAQADRNSRSGPRELAVDVCVNEVGVQEGGSP